MTTSSFPRCWLPALLLSLPLSLAAAPDGDNDGLPDAVDPAPMEPLKVWPRYEMVPAIGSAATLTAEGDEIYRVGRPGNRLRISGARLEGLGAKPMVVISMEAETPGSTAETRLFPAEVVDEALEIDLDWSRPGPVTLFATDGRHSTPPMDLWIASRDAPFLYSGQGSVERQRATLTLKGEGLTADSSLTVNGKALPITSRQGDTLLTATLPPDLLQESVAQVRTAKGESNRMHFTVTRKGRIRVQLPKGSLARLKGLEASGAMLQISKVDAGGNADVLLMGPCTYVMVDGLPAEAGSDMALYGFAGMRDTLTVVDARTTAMAFAYLPLLAGGADAAQLCALREQAADLPEIKVLQAILEEGLLARGKLPALNAESNTPLIKAAIKAVVELLRANRASAS